MTVAGGKSPGERGETLLEVVLAITFISVAVIALVAGLGTAATLASSHRSLTLADVTLKSTAEAVKNASYEKGAATALVKYRAVVNALPPAPGGLLRTVESVRCITTNAAQTAHPASAASTCGATADSGLQLVELRIYRGDGTVSETTTIVKRAT